ncbi:hypothetical protein [Haliscomenobacter sp.]|uniref:hypothetical protein n=1 Tax=Haliscomenobacter sp. TaxID=2717303 RepID=UPI003364F0EF
MHTVRVDSIEVFDAIDLKNQLLQTGLIIEQDFEWAWITAEYNNVEGWTRQKHAEFRFYDPALATFYQLKWAR